MLRSGIYYNRRAMTKGLANCLIFQGNPDTPPRIGFDYLLRLCEFE
jgi:hypothetical protein